METLMDGLNVKIFPKSDQDVEEVNDEDDYH
jgi:hypothetical protein